MTESGPMQDGVYHMELRQFPHNTCRFNIPWAELRETVLVPWAQERWIEFGERKWSPHQATLTVLRGPRIPFGQLTMGRGWRAAQRSSQDVTEELLALVRGELEGGGGEPFGGGRGASGGGRGASGEEQGAPVAARAIPAVAQVAADGEPAVPAAGGGLPPTGDQRRVADLAADSLGLELLGQLGGDAAPLRRAWELAAQRNPDATASAALALAEGAVESLLRARLVALVRVGRASEEAVPVVGEEAARLVRAAASWMGADGAAAVGIRRV